MSSLLLTGGGIGLYMLLKSRCGPSEPGLGRTGSSLSNDSLIKKNTKPRNYGNVPFSDKPTNVYRSALSDDVNHRHGRLGSSYTKGTLSDWS